MKLVFLIGVLVFSIGSKTDAGINEEFPCNEIRILTEVSQEYGLDEEETRLLFSIRKVENGAPGIEMGVGQDYPDHPARRFKGDFEKSLKLQARWAAGTIKKRYSGDLQSFSQRYCKRHQLWYRLVTRWMTKLSADKIS